MENQNANTVTFKTVFERLATKYAEYVEAKIASAAVVQSQQAVVYDTHEWSRDLQDDVRTVNVLAVTLARMEALEKETAFGVNSGI